VLRRSDAAARDSDEEGRTSGAGPSRAVQRLLDEAGGFAIISLLHDVGEGADFETAFAYHMQRSLADFEASLKSP
jgi:hypothetical protein